MTTYAPSVSPSPVCVPSAERLPADLASLASAREEAWEALIDMEAAEDDFLCPQWREVAAAKESARANDAVAKGRDPLKLSGGSLITEAETRRIRVLAAHGALVQRVKDADSALFTAWTGYLADKGGDLMDTARKALADAGKAYEEAHRAAEVARASFGLAAGWLSALHVQRGDSRTEYIPGRTLLDGRAGRGAAEVRTVLDLLEMAGADPHHDGTGSAMVTVRFPDGRRAQVHPDHVQGVRNLGGTVVGAEEGELRITPSGRTYTRR